MPAVDAFFLRLPLFQRMSDRNTRLLYAIRLLRDILNRITLFFLPIYLYMVGKDSDVFAFAQASPLQAGMLMIAVFYFITRLVMLLTAIPSGQIISRLGFQYSVTISYGIRTLAFVSLYFSFEHSWLIVVAAALEGLQANFFWNSFFTALTQTASARTMGSNLGSLHFLIQLVSVLTPAFSGYLAAQYGFQVLFLLGIVFCVLSTIFTIHINLQLPKDKVSWKEFVSWLGDWSFRRLAGSMVGRYINDSVIFLWPLYVFLILGSTDRVGFLYTFSLFLSMLMSFFLGSYLDKKHSKRPFKISGGLLTILWVVRTQVFTAWGIALVDMFERFFANVHWLFYDWIFIRRGKGGQALSYYVYREIIVSCSALLFWGIFATFFLMTNSWNALFLFGGVGVLLSLLITDRHHEKET